MAVNSKNNTRVQVELANKKIIPPKEWTGLSFSASFTDDEVQADNISVDSLTFSNTSNSKPTLDIMKYISDSNPGIFEGLPIKISASNIDNTFDAFDGYLDLTDDYVEFEDGSVGVKLRKKDGLQQLNERLEAITWGLLEQDGLVTQSDYTDLDYLIEPKTTFLEIIISDVILFLMVKELAESIRALSEQINDAFGHAAGGISGGAASAIWTATQIIITAIYTTFIAVAVFNLGKRLFELLFPILRKHKCINLRRALEIIAGKLGYNFVSPASEFDNIYFLPSNRRDDELTAGGLIKLTRGTPSGVPLNVDFGYNCLDFFNTAKLLINGRASVIGNDLHLRSENDSFWIKNSLFKLESKTLLPEKRYNTSDLRSRISISMRTDLSDTYTLSEYIGTSVEITTEPIKVNNPDAVYISGLQEYNINAALANRKNDLSPLERVLRSILGIIDNTIGAIGGNSNLASLVNKRIGVMRVSSNNHSVPKLVYLSRGRIPQNHRDLFSMRILWDKYYNYKSFVQNNNNGQRAIYNSVKIPFGMKQFLQLIQNSYFLDGFGSICKAINIQWNILENSAEISFWKQETYTTNLKETLIQAQ